MQKNKQSEAACQALCENNLITGVTFPEGWQQVNSGRLTKRAFGIDSGL
jgi:hypothetical protein